MESLGRHHIGDAGVAGLHQQISLRPGPAGQGMDWTGGALVLGPCARHFQERVVDAKARATRRADKRMPPSLSASASLHLLCSYYSQGSVITDTGGITDAAAVAALRVP